MKGLIDANYAEAEEEEEEELYGAEDDAGEDEYGAEGEEGDYGEEEGDEEEWPPKDRLASKEIDDRFFRAGESLRGRYTEVEVDGFMKLLGVKPKTQWEDTSVHHYKLGMHHYEDEA